MNLGIVGSEQAKFTQITERAARMAIATMIITWGPTLVVSGHSPLGGVDLYAIEEAERLGVKTREYAPRRHYWAAPGGYRDRNLKIAKDSDVVACVTLKELPPTFQGMRFDACYHCLRRRPGLAPDDHVKSGGCWTMWQAVALGKKGARIVVGPNGSVQASIIVTVSPQSADPAPGD